MLCAPSLGGESFGMVLTEAFASGTPVVASDIAGYRDVVRPDVDGVLVPPGSAMELGEALRSLALDPARCKAMGGEAHERSERFAWPQVAREVVEVYDEARSAPSTGGGVSRAAGRLGLKPAEPTPRRRPRRIPSPDSADPISRRRGRRSVPRGLG